MTGVTDLPPEVRNQIYLLLEELYPSAHHNCATNKACGDHIHVKNHFLVWYPYVPSSVPLREPAITRTCQLVRHESLAIYYGANLFKISTGWIKADWLEPSRYADATDRVTKRMYSYFEYRRKYVGLFRNLIIETHESDTTAICHKFRQNELEFKEGALSWTSLGTNHAALTEELFKGRLECERAGNEPRRATPPREVFVGSLSSIDEDL